MLWPKGPLVFPRGSSSPVAWTPSMENLTILAEKGNYNATTGIWTPSASAGSSATRTLACTTPLKPAEDDTGSPVWNAEAGQFYPTVDGIGIPFGDYATASAGTVILVTRRQHGGSYGADMFFTNGYALYNSWLTSSGGGDPGQLDFEFQLSDGVGSFFIDVPVTNNTMVMTQLTWNGSSIRARVNDGAFQETAATPIASADMEAEAGFGFSTDTDIEFALRFAAITNTVLPDETLDKFYAWALVNDYFAL